MSATEIINIDENNIENPVELQKLQKAAEIIKNGGLVIFPTETVYGLGANAFDASAVEKIYAAKGRPSDNPLIVHFANLEDIYRYAEVPDTANKLIKKFMPAPLTLVLKKKGSEFDSSCKLDTVAVRVPKNITARKLIELSGVPIVAPSANLSGKPSPTNAEHIIHDLSGKVDMIICGKNCEIGLESTVISFNSDDSINILRSGYITREMLSEFKICENFAYFTNPETSEIPRAPGMKYTHYSPNAPLCILSGEDNKIINFINKKLCEDTKKIGFLSYTEMLDFFVDNKNIVLYSLGSKYNLEEQAKNLFAALNKFNEHNDIDIIYSVEPARNDIGEAIYNRLIKAAGGEIIVLNE